MYITQKLSIDQLYNIAINDAQNGHSEYDPMTRLRSRTFYGRPDFKAIYTRLRSAIELGAFLGARETRTTVQIGTYFCGVRCVLMNRSPSNMVTDRLLLISIQPGPLARVVKENAVACSTPTANFTFAKVSNAVHMPLFGCPAYLPLCFFFDRNTSDPFSLYGGNQSSSFNQHTHDLPITYKTF